MAGEIQTVSFDRNPFEKLGTFFIRYGLVLVLGWIGAMKFTAYEAEGIKTLVETSPFMSWMYKVLSLQATSNVIGVAELTAAALIAIRPLSAKLSAIGSVLAVLTFLTTLTFLFSLPGWEKSLGGFPALSGSGGFLLKDTVLLGAALFTLGDSLRSNRRDL
jgi:reactive chlorine resistance protein C